MSIVLARLTIARDADALTARRVAQKAALGLGLDRLEQVRLVAAIGEIGPSTIRAGGTATIVLSVQEGAAPELEMAIQISVDPGYVIRASLPLLAGPPDVGTIVALRESIARTVRSKRSVLSEVRRQDKELLAALEDARSAREEVARLIDELHETNRGVMAMQAPPGGTVLLADVEEPFRPDLPAWLAPSHRVIHAQDAPRALELMRQLRPDVMILALGADFDLLVQLSLPELASIPYVVVTATEVDRSSLPQPDRAHAVLLRSTLTKEALLDVIAAATGVAS